MCSYIVFASICKSSTSISRNILLLQVLLNVQRYSSLAEESLEFERVDGVQLVRDVAASLGEVFKKASVALQVGTATVGSKY